MGLYSSEVIYTGPRQVTITVKETKTETTGLPVATDVSSHITETYSGTSRLEGPAASSATKELDDLMASLSDFKVCYLVGCQRSMLISIVIKFVFIWIVCIVGIVDKLMVL